MKTPKFSIGSWAFLFGPFENHPWSFDRSLAFTANSGYDGIEISGFHPHPHPNLYNTREKCLELKKKIEDLGLGISGFAPDFRDVPPAVIHPQLYLDTLDGCIRFCNYMEIDALRVDSVSPPEHLPDKLYKQRFDHLAGTWQAAAAACKAAGIRMVWEFEPGFWLNKPSEVMAILEAIDHSHFKVMFDTSHAYMGALTGARQTGEKELLEGGIVEYARMLKSHIGHFHLIDSDGTLHHHETSTHTPMGEGHIDFHLFLTETREIFEPFEWWCFDFCFCPTTEVDAPRAIDYIKNILSNIA